MAKFQAFALENCRRLNQVVFVTKPYYGDQLQSEFSKKNKSKICNTFLSLLNQYPLLCCEWFKCRRHEQHKQTWQKPSLSNVLEP